MEIELKQGDRGTYVEYLQLALTRAGFPTRIDGMFETMTCRSVQSFFSEDEKCTVNEAEWRQLEPYLRGYTNYTVREGDTFWNIAARFQTDAVKIRTANPGINPSYINVGTVIRVPFSFSVVPTNVTYSSVLNEYVLDGLLVRYPFLFSGSIGKSVMGKPIYYLRIGSGNKQVFYSASYHANEWITTPVLLKFAEDFARADAVGNSLGYINAAFLFQEFTLFLVPMVNPDGVDLVAGTLENQEYLDQATQIAANYPTIPFPSGWKANIAGIDLNLQFPASWEQARSIKFAQGYTSPAPRDYVGEAPLVAPESRAVYDFTRSNEILLILAYHTQGEVIYWKYRDYEPADSARIAEYFGRVSGYQVEETPIESGSAGYKDWFIEYYDRPGYTIEVGLGVNPLPVSQFDQIYQDNFGILLGGMTQLF